MSNDSGPVELDEIDKAIIRMLQVDGRIPYSKLGPGVGLSQAAARQRVQRLVESGVMQVVAVTDPSMLGFDLQAMVGLNIDGDVEAVANEIAELADVDYVVATAGRFDVICEVVCADRSALHELVNSRIRAVDGVRSTEVLTYLHLVKQTYAWGAR